jgi:enoyl-CoA hydratase/carnithine racemase
LTSGPVAYEVDGPVATIKINRPDRRNALNAEVVRQMTSLLHQAGEDSDVGAVVLTGDGDKAFCAGADLAGGEGGGPVQQHFVRAELGDLLTAMRASPLPIVARVNGHALAGGFGLMLACDLVVAADDVEVGTPEVNLGLWPFMITAVIQRDIPRKVALELMLSGRRMRVEEAERWGFVNRAVPRARLDDEVRAVVESLCSKSPLVLKLGKQSFYRASEMAFDESLDYLAGMLALCLQSEDAAEGISAFFQKRTPEWKGR